MTTFERVKQNILRDMQGSKTHTAESCARIMLNNTNRLTNTAEQEKFWDFMQNPTNEEHIPPPICAPMAEDHMQIDQPDTTKCPVENDDEKMTDVTLKNKYFRNGMAMFIQSKPVSTNSSESVQLPIGRLSLNEQPDEKTDVEML